ncbi:MAG: V-type ATP synthase subunit A [Clostridia bacterium]|nr:V-type ATP synthase subunit A [Clostridia bacterium]
MDSYLVSGINGSIITISGKTNLSMSEMVYVGREKLVGEVISLSGDKTTMQVYEETSGLKIGESVQATGSPICATLGPGIIDNIFDGIERPLGDISKISGSFITKGCNVPSLDEKRQFDVTVTAKAGDSISGGEIYAKCPETPIIEHRCLVPPEISGRVTYAAPNGKYRVNDVILKIKDPKGKTHNLTLCQKWPIRIPRPVGRRLPLSRPLITGQRVLDTLFPVAKGGAAAIPGGFGTGKTMTQHQLAKWSDADIIVYVGCGERGNEMTNALEEFRELIDPKNNSPMTYRTILIANTSNMPVAAREASIYTGVTIAEYYRDMGYHVALMADSTSRWAEALREISGRLEEIPAEEGFPSYLPSRLSDFYERAGYMQTLSGREGSVTLIGAVSPQGADFSEPVTQNTKRFTRSFWALDKSLAYARHYPAINWNQSYSEYVGDLSRWYGENVDAHYMDLREQIRDILYEENRLMEIVKLIGSDVLPDEQKLIIETARIIRLGFLQQNCFHKDDTYVPLIKQFKMMQVILHLHSQSQRLIAKQVPISKIRNTGLYERLINMKYTPNDDMTIFDDLISEISEKLDALMPKTEHAQEE